MTTSRIAMRMGSDMAPGWVDVHGTGTACARTLDSDPPDRYHHLA
jgi:hypothetical protein